MTYTQTDIARIISPCNLETFFFSLRVFREIPAGKLEPLPLFAKSDSLLFVTSWFWLLALPHENMLSGWEKHFHQAFDAVNCPWL